MRSERGGCGRSTGQKGSRRTHTRVQDSTVRGHFLHHSSACEIAHTYMFASRTSFTSPYLAPSDGHTPHVDPFTVYHQADTGSTPMTMADGSYYSDAPPARATTPAATSSYYSSNAPTHAPYAQPLPDPYAPSQDTGSGYDVGNGAGGLYATAAARAVASPGAITYSTGGAGGKAAEARMEALRAQQRSVSEIGRAHV